MGYLKPFQQKAVDFHRGILKNFKGTLLSGCEGCGKTRMSITIAGDYKNVLYVTEAKYVKNTEEERDRLLQEHKIGINVDIVSYHKFADPKKIQFKDYDFFIFDECHKLRNYSAQWTKRFTKIKFTDKTIEEGKPEKKFILLSATPITKSIENYVYTIRKTGAFGDMSTDDFYIKYFGAKKSQFGDYWEKGPFQNEADFVQHLNRVTYYIDPEDMDQEQYLPKITTKYIEGDWIDRDSIANETEVRLQNGLNKVPGATRFIASDVEVKNIGTAIILCYYHDVAKELSKKLGYPLALDSKTLVKEVKRIKSKGGFLITTLGLTAGGYSINECDHMYLVESNYQWALDRQSIRRCLRIGKRSTLSVTYIQLKEEAPYIKATETAWIQEVGRPKKTGGISPSRLATLETCPGSYWLPDTTEREFLNPYSAVGNARHDEAERLLLSGEKVSETLQEDIGKYVEICRGLMFMGKRHGIEEQVVITEFGHTIKGFIDFWGWNGKTLIVIDYKNGSSYVKVNDNIQLEMYAYMICKKFRFKPKNIKIVVVQKDKVKESSKNKDTENNKDNKYIDAIGKRLESIIDKVEKAKDNPREHLDSECRSAFCRAVAYHQKINGYKEMKGENMPKKPVIKRKPKSPTFNVKGVVGVSINKETKRPQGKKKGKQNYLAHKLIVPKSVIPVGDLKDKYAPRDFRSLQSAVQLPTEQDFDYGVLEDERIFWINDWRPNASDLGDHEVDMEVFAKFGEEGRVFMEVVNHTVLKSDAFGDEDEETEKASAAPVNSNPNDSEEELEEEKEVLGF